MFERKDLNKSETWYWAKYYVQKYITVLWNWIYNASEDTENTCSTYMTVTFWIRLSAINTAKIVPLKLSCKFSEANVDNTIYLFVSIQSILDLTKFHKMQPNWRQLWAVSHITSFDCTEKENVSVSPLDGHFPFSIMGIIPIFLSSLALPENSCTPICSEGEVLCIK